MASFIRGPSMPRTSSSDSGSAVVFFHTIPPSAVFKNVRILAMSAVEVVDCSSDLGRAKYGDKWFPCILLYHSLSTVGQLTDLVMTTPEQEEHFAQEGRARASKLDVKVEHLEENDDITIIEPENRQVLPTAAQIPIDRRQRTKTEAKTIPAVTFRVLPRPKSELNRSFNAGRVESVAPTSAGIATGSRASQAWNGPFRVPTSVQARVLPVPFSASRPASALSGPSTSSAIVGRHSRTAAYESEESSDDGEDDEEMDHELILNAMKQHGTWKNAAKYAFGRMFTSQEIRQQNFDRLGTREDGRGLDENRVRQLIEMIVKYAEHKQMAAPDEASIRAHLSNVKTLLRSKNRTVKGRF